MRIISVFYHEIAGCVNDSDNITVRVMDIVILDAVVLYKGRNALFFIEEMQIFRALSAAFIHGSLGRMGNRFTAENRTMKYSFVESMPFARRCLPRAWKLLYTV